MTILKEKPPIEENSFEEVHPDLKTQHDKVNLPSHRWKILIFVSLLLGSILIIIASLQKVTKTDEDQLEALQSKIDKRELLKDFEKEAYCDLLWKVKKVRLCACKKNFIKDIGSLTGYKVKDSDLDWRGSRNTFESALEEAFRRTGIPKERFVANKWGFDINGKSGVVEWKGPRGSEVSVDAPHEVDGPDVFHIGFKALDADDQKIRGHIFLDCVPYFRGKRKEK